MSAEKYLNDYKLIDGNKIIRAHTTEFILEEFLVAGLEKIKVLAMNLALTEEQADVLLDCMIDEHFAFGGDMKGFEVFVETIGSFLDYFTDRLPKSVQIPDDTIPDMEESIPNLEESIPNLELTEEAETQAF